MCVTKILDFYVENKSNRYTLDSPPILKLADLFNEPFKQPRWQRVKDWDSQLNQDFQND